MRVPLIIVVLVVLVAGVFAFQNNQVITVRFFNYAWMTSQSIVIVASVAAGFLAGVVVMLPGSFKRWRRARSLEKELGSLKKELEAARRVAEEARNGDERA